MTTKRSPAAAGTAEAARIVAEVDDLTWTGQPEAAIAQATAALAAGGLAPEQEAALLDLRAENHHWRGETEACAEDAQALGALARRTRSPAFGALGLRREAMIAFRRGDIDATLRMGDAALAAARESADEVIEAHCLATLGFLRAMARSDPESAPDLVRRAVPLARRLRQRQAVPVGRHQREVAAAGHQQDAVQEVPRVVARRRKLRAGEHLPEQAGRKREASLALRARQ